MEDEQGTVGQGSSGGGPAAPLSGNLPSENLVESMGGDNQVEGPYGGGDEAEIMVEVVGSDVFVDGVSGSKEGHFESGEVGDLEGRVAEKTEESEARNFSEAMDVSGEGDGNKMGKGDLGFSESSDEKHFVGTEGADISLSKSVDAKGDAVSAAPSRGVDVPDDEVWNPGIEAADGSSSVPSMPTAEAAGPSPMVISEEKETKDAAVNKDNTEPSPMMISEERKTEAEAVNKNSTDLETPEPLNHPAEAVSDEKADIPERNKVLPSSDNSVSHNHFGADSTMSHGETKAGHGGLEPAEVSLNPNSEGSQNVWVDGTDSVSLGEHLDSRAHRDGNIRAEPECARTDVDGGMDEKLVDKKEIFAAESKDSMLKLDSLVSDVQVKSQGCLDEPHGTMFEPNDQIDCVSHADTEPIHENSFVSERGEAIGNDECLKNDGDFGTHKAHQNHVFSNETIQPTDGGVKDKCPHTEILDDKKQNEPNMTSLSCPADKEIVQTDSVMQSNQPLIATAEDAERDDQNVVMSLAKVVDGGASSEKGGGGDLNSEMSQKSSECQGDAEIPALDVSTENMHISVEGACPKVETADVRVTEDNVVCHNPTVNSEVGFDNIFEECGLQVPVQIAETSNHEVDKLENINLTANDDVSVAAVSDITQVCIPSESTERAELLVSSANISLVDGGDIEENPGCHVASSIDEVYKSREEDDKPRESNGFYTSETKLMDMEEDDQMYHGGQEVDEELGTEGHSFGTDKLKLSNEETLKPGSSLRMNQSGYLMPSEIEGHFAQSDLVWGKVRSHPWWPGQIFDPADASEKAVKYYKKDSYLVAYFGDQTFAWNDSSALKPFRSHFSQIEKQSNSEAFQNAVNCALEEVERRVELGLSCSCIPKDAHAKIETQIVENAGIREESSRRYGVDKSSRASHFEPDKLLEYVGALAPRASSGADRLDLVIAQAQLSAFYRFKGYRSPTEFPSPGELLETDADTEQISDEMVASHKRKHIPKDGSPSRKERSLTELMGDREYSPDAEDESAAGDLGKPVSLSSAKKRKALDPSTDGLDKKVSVYPAKVSTPTSQAPKPSFKIGECIRRVASQLTGSVSLVKGSNDEMVIDGSPNIYEHSEKQSAVVSAESLSVNEMLSQLQLLAEDPKKRHSIQNNIRAFFLGFRSSIALNRRGRKKKSEQTIGGSGEEFEFDDVNDSYWTDRIVQNYSEEQLLHDSENGAANLQVVPFGAEKSVKAGRKSHSRKRFSSGNSPTAANEVDENVKRRKQESSPAELILNFAERNSVPSEINLNKIFRRFGPLMESETEVDHESGCAKVIFKRGSDAEVARNSAEKFNIFGPVLVNYQIGYSPVISVKILPVAIPQPQEDATLML